MNISYFYEAVAAAYTYFTCTVALDYLVNVYRSWSSYSIDARRFKSLYKH